MYTQCYIEKIGELWYICYPDCTKAWIIGYRSQQAATTVLKWLSGSSKSKKILLNCSN